MASTASFSGSTPSTETRVTWTAATNVLTIHLGTRTSGTVNAGIAAITVTYTPSSAFEDLAGNQVQPTGRTGTLRF